MVSSLTRLGWYSGLWYFRRLRVILSPLPLICHIVWVTGHLESQCLPVLCLLQWSKTSLTFPQIPTKCHQGSVTFHQDWRQWDEPLVGWEIPLTSEVREWLTSQHCGILFSWTFPLSPSHQKLLLALDPVRHSALGRSPLALDMMSICSSTYQLFLTGTRKTLPGRHHSPSSPRRSLPHHHPHCSQNLLCSTWAAGPYLLCIFSIIRVQFLTLRKCSMDKGVARDSQNCSTAYADVMPFMTMSP